MNNQQKYKKSKILNGVLCALLALLIVGSVTAVGIISNGFKDWGNAKPPAEEPADTNKNDKGDLDFEQSETNGVSLTYMKIAEADYEQYGINPLAQTAYTVTATITPANAANKKVDWSLTFSNTNSAWSTGKKVTDYVTVTPASDGALTATVQCKAAFGDKVNLVVKSRENAMATATVSIGYRQRIESWDVTINNVKFTTGSSSSVKLDFSQSFSVVPAASFTGSTVYTEANVDDTTNRVKCVKVVYSSDFITYLTGKGVSSSMIGGLYKYDVNGLYSGWFDKKLSDEVAPKWGLSFNKLVDTLKAYTGTAAVLEMYADKDCSKLLGSSNITFDTSLIVQQYKVEGVKTDKTELLF